MWSDVRKRPPAFPGHGPAWTGPAADSSGLAGSQGHPGRGHVVPAGGQAPAQQPRGQAGPRPECGRVRNTNEMLKRDQDLVLVSAVATAEEEQGGSLGGRGRADSETKKPAPALRAAGRPSCRRASSARLSPEGGPAWGGSGPPLCPRLCGLGKVSLSLGCGRLPGPQEGRPLGKAPFLQPGPWTAP